MCSTEVITEHATVHSSEALYEHMLIGWEVFEANVEEKVWELDDIERIRQARDHEVVPVSQEWVDAGMPLPSDSEEEA